MIQSAKKKMFWTSGCWIDFILNILLELNVFQDLAMLPGHDRSLKNPKIAF